MIPVFYYHYFQFVLTKYVFVWFYQEKKRDEMICKKKTTIFAKQGSRMENIHSVLSNK